MERRAMTFAVLLFLSALRPCYEAGTGECCTAGTSKMYRVVDRVGAMVVIDDADAESCSIQLPVCGEVVCS